MVLKDYYKTLGVSPLAAPADIKKAFRQLALRFHPDKNEGDAQTTALFREIQEAYEVLSDPLQREEYNYKRWYRRSLGKEYDTAVVTPATILAACNRLEQYVSTTNIFQVDYDGLSHHIRQLLSDTNIGILQQAGEKTINAQVIQQLTRAAMPLPFEYVEPIAKLLLHVAGTDRDLSAGIYSFIKTQSRNERWAKYKTVVIVAATLLLCWLIYNVSK